MNLFAKDRDSSAESAILKFNHTDPQSLYRLSAQFISLYADCTPLQDKIIVCIGTDRSTGDALGPLVGTNLSKYQMDGMHIYGTLDEPVHALNLADTIKTIQLKHRQPFILGIDACLGQISSVGCIQVGKGPVKPGAGVNKELPAIGDIHVTGIVNVGGFMEYFVLQNTRLSLVVRMAEMIAHAIYLSSQTLASTGVTRSRSFSTLGQSPLSPQG